MPVALQSLLVQGAALALAALFYHLIPLDSFALWQLALLQGALAAVVSRAWRQPPWWPVLHFAFAPALWAAHRLALPPGLYLVAFGLLLLFYWSSFRTQVPLYLSGRDAWDAVAERLPADRPFRFVDLGSGLGGLPLYLASRFPQGRFVGVEVAPAPWLISRVRASMSFPAVRFSRRDYRELDLGEFDVVFAFLSPAAMPGVWQQAQRQMRPGTVFMSLAFPVESHPADEIVLSGGRGGHALHVWHMVPMQGGKICAAPSSFLRDGRIPS